jgi:hypothetical protein
MSKTVIMPPAEAATRFLQRGWSPIPVTAGGKMPLGKGWQKQHLTLVDVSAAFRGNANIGLLLGEPSGGLVDVDIDHPIALSLARLLPKTGMIHGRTGNPASHHWYQIEGDIPATAQFKDPVSGQMLIELRSTGGQTVVPPSRYTNKEGGTSQLTWEVFEAPAQISASELHQTVSRVAAITLLAIHWKQQGSRHATALALSGFLLRGGCTTEMAERIIAAVCAAAGDDEEKDRVATVASTAEKLESNEPASGATKLAELLDGKIVSTLQKWLGLKRSAIPSLPSSSQIGSSHEFSWDVPALFDDVSTPEIPSTLLPGIYGNFARSLALAAEVPESLTTMAVLGVLSAVCAKRFVIAPQSGWDEPINLYVLAALPPANLKSLVVRSSMKPIDAWEFNQRLAMEPAIQLAKSKRKNEESQILSLRGKASKSSDPLKRQSDFAEVNRLEAEMTSIPVPPQIYVNDVTPETLTTVVCEQNGKLAIISDEGGIFEVLAGLYSKGQSNYDIVLKGIDGGRVRLRRKDRDLDVSPYITMLLVVQPQIIRNMSDKKAFQGRGLLERFLYILPRSNLGHRSLDTKPVTEALCKQYDQAVQNLLNIQPDIELGGIETPRTLQLAPAARVVWQAFRHDIEVELGPEGKFACCLGWGGKVAGFTLRIAGLMHIAEHGETTLTIGSDSMERAVNMARLLAEHALAAFGLMRNDEPAEDAQALYEWLMKTGQMEFRRTECQRKFHGRFTGKKRFDAALAVLIDRSIISPLRQETTTEGKRQTGYYDVNPALFESVREAV